MQERKNDSSWTKESLKKIISPDQLKETVQKIRSSGSTIATLNGSFDLLHAGHLHILFEASLQADCLIVCVNTDDSIRSYKGPDRPIIPLKERMEMLAALGFVDYVTYFEQTDAKEIITTISPDIHVNGEEYGGDFEESVYIQSKGIKLHLVDRIAGLSSSDVIKKIQACDSSVV